MATLNTKRIEESATLALKSALLRCPTLSAYISENDKTPSWDGQVFVYGSAGQKKSDGILVVPVQVKGTINKLADKSISYSCEVSDLKIWMQNGGCMLFLVSVDLESQSHKIYYSGLQVYDLKKELETAKHHKSRNIQLQKFPQDDPSEMTNIISSFAQDRVKQASFANKELPCLDDLAKRGIKVENISFSVSGIGITPYDIGKYVSSHEIYLYAKPEGLDVEIPIDKVKNMTMYRPVSRPVYVAGQKHYDSYLILNEKGDTLIKIGKGISIKFFETENRLTLQFKPTGTLSDFIRDATFMVNVYQHREIKIGEANFPLGNLDAIDIDQYTNSLTYYKDVKKMLDILGVTEELQCTGLTAQDETNLKNFVFAVLYHREIGFPQTKETDTVIHGPFKIANLSIWIWAERQKNGKYIVENYFAPHLVATFASDDMKCEHPHPVSHFIMMDKTAFTNSSNIDYQCIENDLLATKLTPLLIEPATLLLLEMLKAYDEHPKKSAELLRLAEKTCIWIEQSATDKDSHIAVLNKMQIIKRQRKLNVSELLKLGQLIESDVTADIKCGAYLLLDDNESSQKCFGELPVERQMEFLSYPICHFGKLEETHNG